MITRRRLIQTFCALPLVACMPRLGHAQNIVDFSNLKDGYAQRLKKILAAGEMPYVDIESSCNSTKLDIDFVAKSMDRLNIGLMALSADIGSLKAEWRDLIVAYPQRFLSALDLGGDRLYRSAWSLLFGEEFA